MNDAVMNGRTVCAFLMFLLADGFGHRRSPLAERLCRSAFFFCMKEGFLLGGGEAGFLWQHGREWRVYPLQAEAFMAV